MVLNCQSKKGKQAMQEERLAMQSFCDVFKYQWCETPHNTMAACDGVLVKEGELKAVGEVKCRYNVGFDDFFDRFNGEWLVTASKLKKCKDIADGLGVNFVGFLYLVDSKKLLFKPITSWRSEETETITNINNPTLVKRLNGFVDMAGSKYLSL